jgi:hypothetical protein
MDDLLQQGITAYKAGKRDEARKIFITVVKQSSDNETAWGWMYQASNNDQERIHCLKQILRINPKSEKANQLLYQLLAPPLTSISPSSIKVGEREKAQQEQLGKKLGLWGFGLIVFIVASIAIGGAGALYVKNLSVQATVEANRQLQINYVELSMAAARRCSDADQAFSSLFYVYDGSPAWRQQVEVQLRNLELCADGITNLPPPPPDMAEADSWLRKIPPEQYAMTADVRTGLNRQDYKYIERATIHTQNVTYYLNTALSLLSLQP